MIPELGVWLIFLLPLGSFVAIGFVIVMGLHLAAGLKAESKAKEQTSRDSCRERAGLPDALAIHRLLLVAYRPRRAWISCLREHAGNGGPPTLKSRLSEP